MQPRTRTTGSGSEAARAEVALRHLPRAQHLAPSARRHRRLGARRISSAPCARASSPDGRHYYPAFPYTSYQRMTAADLLDLLAFLKTLPPSKAARPITSCRFPSASAAASACGSLHSSTAALRARSAKAASWNRGAYLVGGPGHCAECHSERNSAGAIIEERRFAGGPDRKAEGARPQHHAASERARRLDARKCALCSRPARRRISSRSAGLMGSVVRNTAQLAGRGPGAMAEYLLSLPPGGSGAAQRLRLDTQASHRRQPLRITGGRGPL